MQRNFTGTFGDDPERIVLPVYLQVALLLAGQLTVHTLFAPYIPAETIENIREYDVSALESVIGG